jgi:hypothetical protein
MGQIEENIKVKIFTEIFGDSFKLYEFITNRFELTTEEQETIIQSINKCTDELTSFLSDKKLS